MRVWGSGFVVVRGGVSCSLGAEANGSSSRHRREDRCLLPCAGFLGVLAVVRFAS